MTNCDVCGDEFQPRHKRQRACVKKSCKQELGRQRVARWVESHPAGGKEASARYRAKNGNTPWPAKRALGLEITEMKEKTPCNDCGQSFPAVCMDFDHVTGEKLGNIGTMVAHGHSRTSVMEEIEKCELVCANCHRIRTRDRRTK